MKKIKQIEVKWYQTIKSTINTLTFIYSRCSRDEFIRNHTVESVCFFVPTNEHISIPLFSKQKETQSSSEQKEDEKQNQLIFLRRNIFFSRST